jgi:hypothetical protein
MSLLTLLGGPILSLIEKELIASEPAIANLLVQEIELLINKLHTLIASKQKQTAPTGI